jgi:excisionase family DNA binding protein
VKTTPQLLTTREVAGMLRLSTSRIQELVAAGVLHPLRLTATSNYRFRQADIEELISRAQADPELEV